MSIFGNKEKEQNSSEERFTFPHASEDQINQSILLQAKGVGERFKGDLTARTETMRAFSSLLSTGQQFGMIG